MIRAALVAALLAVAACSPEEDPGPAPVPVDYAMEGDFVACHGATVVQFVDEPSGAFLSCQWQCASYEGGVYAMVGLRFPYVDGVWLAPVASLNGSC
jgi:hypothetical protein